ncbi:hypothetical protein VIBNISFn118_20030 [Vibrio nigripulchritudo SFn118]|nr:hypothetical protein VIBNISFn118_20030 [Vibrio nigripulchritudo SFn118]
MQLNRKTTPSDDVILYVDNSLNGKIQVHFNGEHLTIKVINNIEHPEPSTVH